MHRHRFDLVALRPRAVGDGDATPRRHTRFPTAAAVAPIVLAVTMLLASCGTSGNTVGAGAVTGTSAIASTAAATGAAVERTTASTSSTGISSSSNGTAATSGGTAALSARAASAQTPADGGVAAGRALYVSNGCVACHGDNAEGKIGPKIAGTGLTFAEVLHQVRQPRGVMPPFSPQQVNDAQVQQIYAYLESLAPPTPTPAPVAQTATTSVSVAVTPLNVDAIVAAVDDLKVASDYAHDAAKTVADLHTYGGQAAQALKAAQAAVQAAKTAGGGSAELKADLDQLQQLLGAVAPDVQAAASATSVEAAAPHTEKMVLASRLDLLPLALELVRVNGEVGAVTGTVKDTAGRPVAQALVTIEGGNVHTGLITDADGNFKASGIAAFRAVEVKAYKAGYLYVESHAPVTRAGTASVVITIPPESDPAASPKVSNAVVPAGAIAGTASAHFSLTATQKDNQIAEDQIWALSPEAGVAYVLRGSGNNAYTLDQKLPNLKAGTYTWYFFATTHECDMSSELVQHMTVQ